MADNNSEFDVPDHMPTPEAQEAINQAQQIVHESQVGPIPRDYANTAISDLEQMTHERVNGQVRSPDPQPSLAWENTRTEEPIKIESEQNGNKQYHYNNPDNLDSDQ